MFVFLDVPAEGAFHLVSWLATATGTAAAIVLFTVVVRLLLHPLARSAVHGEKTRSALAPQVAEIRKRHSRDPERIQREMLVLYRNSGTSPFAGCLPSLLQLPVFMVLYRLFTATTFDGTPNDLLGEQFFGTPLGSHLLDGVGGPVFAGLFMALLVVGHLSARAMPAQTPRFLRLLPYGTSLAVTVIPLAAGLYLFTTTAWTVLERACLRR